MKTMFDNLNAIVANTLTDSIQMIDIDELHESKDNFFFIDRIEEFAETILGQGGVKDNLVVRPLETGGYEIISGHRRKAAVQYLLDNGENISRYLPCLVQDYADDDTKILDIVLMNISARQISDAELWKSYEILDRILQNKKDAGEKFGRTREKLAECLGVSPAQVSKMQNVEHHAIPSIKEAVENGNISISTANEIAKLNTEEQEKLVQQGDLSDIKHKDVKQMNKEKVDTCSNYLEDELDSQQSDEQDAVEKVDTCSNFSEDEPSSQQSDECDTTEKVDTYSNYSEDEPDSQQSDELDTTEKVDTYINFSENEPGSQQPDEQGTEEKVDTNINFGEDEPDTQQSDEQDTAKKVDTNINFPDVENATDVLSKFVHEHYFELETIFMSYASLTDSDEEIQIIEEFQELLRKVKEAERGKIRFGV